MARGKGQRLAGELAFSAIAGRLASQADVDAALLRLLELDPRLMPVAEIAGETPLRARIGGLAGLAAIVTAQQVSKASADAIHKRLAQALDLHSHRAILDASDEVLRAAGLSAPKQRTLRAIAGAIETGALDLDRVSRSSAAEAIAELTAVRGIGVWTAECYLLFCVGHLDIFPSGDLALQAAIGHALNHAERPDAKTTAEIAAAWTPYRSVAARLLWAYYGRLARRDVAPAPSA